MVEHIHFADYLGHDFPSTDFFNYTFRHRERATMGTMRLITWCSYDQDVYPYNDTLSKNINGMTAITDVQATAGFIDTRYFNHRMGIVLDNVGARAVNNFLVGYYFDRDTTTRREEIFSRATPLAAGEHAVYMFDTTYHREAPWVYLTVYCSMPGDTNQMNDTSTYIQPYTTDLEMMRLEVEENMSDSCRVRMVIRNNGNITWYVGFRVDNRINDVSIPRAYSNEEIYIQPGQMRHVMLERAGRPIKIPKNRNRQYVGMGSLNLSTADDNPSNDQTTQIVVLNYFEDIPNVYEPDFVLEQNYPNPYDGTTRIEFSLPYNGNTRFFVTDVVGRVVHEEVKYYGNGRHVIAFDKGSLPAGVYYYGLEFDGERRMHKMIIK